MANYNMNFNLNVIAGNDKSLKKDIIDSIERWNDENKSVSAHKQICDYLSRFCNMDLPRNFIREYEEMLLKLGLMPWYPGGRYQNLRNLISETKNPEGLAHFIAGSTCLANKWDINLEQLNYVKTTGIPIQHLTSAAKIYGEIDGGSFAELKREDVWNISFPQVLKLRKSCRSDSQFSKVLKIFLEELHRGVEGNKPLTKTHSYKYGVHIGEIISGRMPTRRIINRGENAIRLYIRMHFNLPKIPELWHSDALRVMHLSPFWQRVAVTCCAYKETFSGGRRKEVIWELVAHIMKHGIPDRDFLEKYENKELTKILVEEGTAVEWDRSYLLKGDFQRLTWMKYFGRVPNKKEIFELSRSLVRQLKPNFKFFMRLLKNIEMEPHTIEAAATLAIVFGARAADIVKEHSIHDAGINLFPPYSKDTVEFLYKNRGDTLQRAIRVANNIQGILMAGGNLNMPLKRLEEISASLTYENVLDMDLAQECAKHSISQEYFEKIQSICLSKEKIEVEYVPSVSAQNGAYKMYRLDKSDYRALFMGFYTDCCQHVVEGAGRSCAWHSMYNEKGATYVVERNGVIIAQSWTWRYGDTIVFDNVEVLGSSYSMETIKSLYKEVSEKMLDSLCVNRVHVGTGYDDVGLEEFKRTEAVSTPSGCYSDAYNQKLIIAKEVV